MKLSEQYENRINELKTIDSLEPASIGSSGSEPQGLLPAFSPYDIHSYITYGWIGASLLALIFGKSYVLKKIGIDNKIDKPGLIARIRDKKGLKNAGLSNQDIRDIWIRSKRILNALDQKTIHEIFTKVEKGKITAVEAMKELGNLVPRGHKTINYNELKKLEDKALMKKTAKKSIKPKIKYEDINPINISKDQFLKLRPNQILALKTNPSLTFNQLGKY